MRRCPHCGALAFDDMETCYGCLYHFTERDLPLGQDDMSQEKDISRIPATNHAGWHSFEEALEEEYEDFLSNKAASGPGESPKPLSSIQVPENRVELPKQHGEATATVAMLVRRSGDGEEISCPLLAGSTLDIGRSKKNDIVLSAPNVSRQHARIGVEEGRVWLEDLHSSNHTYCNGTALSRRVHLAPGDEFLICGTSFLIRPPEQMAAARIEGAAVH